MSSVTPEHAPHWPGQPHTLNVAATSNHGDFARATFDIQGLISVLSAEGIKKQLLRLPGIQQADVNYVSGTATVEFDPQVSDRTAIEARIRECGYHCGGEVLPKHICSTAKEAAAVRPLLLDTSTPSPPAKSAAAAAMRHEMGHGAGMGLADMARDMRNRFWISLIFALPVFLYSPMSSAAPLPRGVPFGLRLDVWLFSTCERGGVVSGLAIRRCGGPGVAQWRAQHGGWSVSFSRPHRSFGKRKTARLSS